MTPTQSRTFVRRWNQIKVDRDSILHQTIELARDIRATYEAGEGGDEEFRSYCCSMLQTSVSGANRLLRFAQACDNLVDADHLRFSAETICLISRVSETMQRRFVGALRRKARSAVEGRVTITTARQTLQELGIKLPTGAGTGPGRPYKAVTEDRLNTLRRFIADLYREFTGLPNLTEEVLEAMQNPQLNRRFHRHTA